jgi:hypothetical protein
MRWSTLLWVIVPGVGQIHLGHAGKGILLFTLFTVILNAYCLSLVGLILPDTMVRTTLLALAVLVWLIAAVDYVRESAEEDLVQVAQRAAEESERTKVEDVLGD